MAAFRDFFRRLRTFLTRLFTPLVEVSFIKAAPIEVPVATVPAVDVPLKDISQRDTPQDFPQRDKRTH
jgi:hypothetical protein